MGAARERPAAAAGEREQLVGWLDLQRAAVRATCAGLPDLAARRAVVPSSPLMTLAGLVCHLRWVEHCWFEVLFLGGDRSANPQFGGVAGETDWMPGETPLAELLARYERQCLRSNEITAAHGLDEPAADPMAASVTLRWTLHHLVEETARHAGHADLVRELLDGTRASP